MLACWLLFSMYATKVWAKILYPTKTGKSPQKRLIYLTNTIKFSKVSGPHIGNWPSLEMSLKIPCINYKNETYCCITEITFRLMNLYVGQSKILCHKCSSNFAQPPLLVSQRIGLSLPSAEMSSVSLSQSLSSLALSSMSVSTFPLWSWCFDKVFKAVQCSDKVSKQTNKQSAVLGDSGNNKVKEHISSIQVYIIKFTSTQPTGSAASPSALQLTGKFIICAFLNLWIFSYFHMWPWWATTI